MKSFSVSSAGRSSHIFFTWISNTHDLTFNRAVWRNGQLGTEKKSTSHPDHVRALRCWGTNAFLKGLSGLCCESGCGSSRDKRRNKIESVYRYTSMSWQYYCCWNQYFQFLSNDFVSLLCDDIWFILQKPPFLTMNTFSYTLVLSVLYETSHLNDEWSRIHDKKNCSQK